MQDSSAFQFLAIDTIHESTTNPRRTFDQTKLYELAESIRHNGLIQPITVRPNNEGFEIVAGARRFRAAQLADLFSVPARIVDIDDAQAQEWALVENSQRVDVHPYEEAVGLKRLLDFPGYDVATLVEKSGKSASHIYARLSLLQLIPAVAEAFTLERITTSHANLIARLPQESQNAAFEQCWRKDWQDKEPHLLPAKHLAAWIQANLYLSLADAPFDRENPTLNPAAGACSACPRRSGFNTSLFCDVQGDQCLDSPCYYVKVNAHIDREIAARPELVQIETKWRVAKQQRPGSLQEHQYWEIKGPSYNPDAEPPCSTTKNAIIVYGKRVGTTMTVCTDIRCPVHDPKAAARSLANQASVNPNPGETENEGKPNQDNDDQDQRRDLKIEQERRSEEQRQRREHEFQRQQEEYAAEEARLDRIRAARAAAFERILENAPANLNAAQLRVLLRALVNLDSHTFIDDLAEEIVGDNENEERTAEEVLLSAIDETPDDQLTRFALRLALTGHLGIPREGEPDFLTEAATTFALPQPTKKSRTKKPTPIQTPSTLKSKKRMAKRKIAA